MLVNMGRRCGRAGNHAQDRASNRREVGIRVATGCESARRFVGSVSSTSGFYRVYPDNFSYHNIAVLDRNSRVRKHG
ncbi:hypothetical protein [Burkholderia sp. Nafp2/4-1b]|uniref:hypothetical protein n=1 Tax=Burkholderia sp. Nafp2/4-1b TaxID=2116686 RepID=UPI0013CEB5F5|nr:hypothetical protein [Burkholderia sp. Nafp2/4-1b]